MRINMNKATLSVATEAPLYISDPRGAALRVVHGKVWITQEGSPDDIFLKAGDAFAFANAGTVVLSAEGRRGESATVAFDEPMSIRSRSSAASAWLAAFRGSWTPSFAV